MPRPVITLTTDFGTRDAYVGSVKGVILGICRDAELVDLSHEVPPQDIAHGAFVLGAAFPYFPPDSVHLAVVDPGVGTERPPLLLDTTLGRFVAPDNGLLTYVVARLSRWGRVGKGSGRRSGSMQARMVQVPAGCAAFVLDKERYWHQPVSGTFHGRDIFGPVAAHLAAGVPPALLGSPVEQMVCLDLPRPRRRGRVIEGQAIYVDSFGNVVSNIRVPDLKGTVAVVELSGLRLEGLAASYGVGEGLLALVGSHGYVEIAWRDGNAAKYLGTGVGAPIRVEIRS